MKTRSRQFKTGVAIMVFGAILIGEVSLLPPAAKAEDQFIYNDHNRRDPFWPLVNPDGSVTTYDTDLLVTDMTLEGVIFDPAGKSLAIINGKVVRAHGAIGPYTVKTIAKDRVILSKDGKEFLLKLKKEE